MRIISGKLKGKKIFFPKNNFLRPTTDKVKEGLFNIISHKKNLKNLTVLDLFCGTGNITYEFASRGVKEIQAIDSHFYCIRYIRNTLKKFKITKQCKVFQKNILFFIKKIPLKSYDLIFADPPYNFSIKKLEFLIKNILYKDWIKKNGCLILEHSNKWKIPNIEFYKTYTKKYGKIHLSFFEKE